MKSLLSTIMFFLFAACLVMASAGIGTLAAGYWWLGLPMIFGGVWGAIAVLEAV